MALEGRVIPINRRNKANQGLWVQREPERLSRKLLQLLEATAIRHRWRQSHGGWGCWNNEQSWLEELRTAFIGRYGRTGVWSSGETERRRGVAKEIYHRIRLTAQASLSPVLPDRSSPPGSTLVISAGRRHPMLPKRRKSNIESRFCPETRVA